MRQQYAPPSVTMGWPDHGAAYVQLSKQCVQLAPPSASPEPWLWGLQNAQSQSSSILHHNPIPSPWPPHRPCQSRSEEHTSELQSRPHLVCRLLLEKKKK